MNSGRIDLPFNDSDVAPEERLATIFAFNRGAFTAIRDLCHQADSYHDLLSEEVEDNPAAIGYLQKSKQAITGACTWLTALLAAVQPETETEPLDISILAEGAVNRCQNIVSSATELKFVVADCEPEIVVSGSLFQLQELLIRSIQQINAMAEGELLFTVAMNVQELDEHFFELLGSNCRPGRYVILSIGPGELSFATQQQTPFWNVFFTQMQSDDVSLLLSYGAAVGHGGDMYFQKSGANGTALTIVLPLLQTRQDMQAPHNLEDESLKGTETILLVDDEDMIWDVIIDMLQELGYSVILAGDGRDAVEIYRNNPGQIDLVLLDMVMPHMDGHEAFFKLKEIDPNVAVLLSSGYVSEDDSADVLKAGALGFLRKPYRMVDLAKKMRGIFDGSR